MSIYDRYRAIRAAVVAEVANSGLPDVNDGAADAYRHMLLSAEFRRQFGRASRWGLQVRELWQEFVGENTPASAAMDRHNNRVGTLTGSRVDTWQEVISETRRQMLAAATLNGSGQKATPTWIVKTPVNQWPTGWDKRSPTKQRFGGKKHRFSQAPDQFMTGSNQLARHEDDILETRQVAEARRPEGARSEASGMLGDALLIEPRAMSMESRDRVAGRLGFDPRQAGGDPGKIEKLAKCLHDCFVREPGFEGLSDGLDRRLGAIAAASRPDFALAVLRGVVPETAQVIPPRRRDQPRRRRTGPVSLDDTGRAAVQQAVLRHGAAPIKTGIAMGAARKAADELARNRMIVPVFLNTVGAGFGGGEAGRKARRATAEAANAINQRSGIPDRADPAEISGPASGRESETAIERAIQAAGPEKFTGSMAARMGGGFGGFLDAGEEDADRERVGGFGTSLLDA